MRLNMARQVINIIENYHEYYISLLPYALDITIKRILYKCNNEGIQ